MLCRGKAEAWEMLVPLAWSPGTTQHTQSGCTGNTEHNTGTAHTITSVRYKHNTHVHIASSVTGEDYTQ